jgi:hypothetical protein
MRFKLCAVAALISANSMACNVFPSNNVWNTKIDRLPVHTYSSAWVDDISSTRSLHADFGSGKYEGVDMGIPVTLLGNKTVKYGSVRFTYADESDSVLYPVNLSIKVEQGGDHHSVVVTENCRLYEQFNVKSNIASDSGATWDLNSNALRPEGWTSADAAGLPILPGLVDYDEVKAGEIRHAIRFTVEKTSGYVWPARHLTDGKPGEIAARPPLGARARLRADFSIAKYSKNTQVILQAMKTFGIILADNGGDWYISGMPNESWDNIELNELKDVVGKNIQFVDSSCMMVNKNSGEADVRLCGNKLIPLPVVVKVDAAKPIGNQPEQCNAVKGVDNYIKIGSIKDICYFSKSSGAYSIEARVKKSKFSVGLSTDRLKDITFATKKFKID